MHLQSNRSFQLWAYSVSHAQLLIRSPRSKEDPKNIDVAFFGVGLIEVPSGFIGLTIEDASTKEAKAVRRRRLRDSSDVDHVYRLITDDEVFFVVAAHLRVSENSLDYRETDLDFMAFVRPGQSLVGG